ncbi:MAG: hypothetical protein EPO09_18720 [Aquabacterium sp.]|uniref:hypothetical protein n=1 Tax=Aquabacterium sp. TaxID=1872578 RepID=UPI00122AEECD|nr:hypothetical protein [Aquabacterium sp.]TAK87538.1 MAG: hypothetical protein EPO09_18720 [Aquabacterium sp.]
MPFRTSTHTLRRLCGLVLLAWLLGVLSGTVNACLLAEPAQDTSAAPLHHHERAHEHADDPAANHRADQQADRHADEHVLCHKFCKDQSLTLPQHKGLGEQDFSPTLIALSGPVLPVAPSIPPTARWMDGPQAQGPPLVIRFLRLAL